MDAYYRYTTARYVLFSTFSYCIIKKLVRPGGLSLINRCMIISDFNTRYFFLLLLGVGIVAALLLWPFFSAIVVAGVLAVLFQFVYKWLMRVTHGNSGVSAGLVCLLVGLIIILPMVSLVGLVVSEVKHVYIQYFSDERMLSQYVSSIESALTSFGFPGLGEGFLSQEQLLGKLEQAGSIALNLAQAIYVGATQFVFWLFVMFFTLFYFLMDGKSLVSRVMRLSPLEDAWERELIRSFESIGRAILKGTFFIGIIQGFFGGVFLTLAGFPSPFTWGVIMVILSLIPFVGAGLVLFPACLWSFAMGDVLGGVLLLVGGIFVTTIDNYLRPKLVGKDTAIHPLLVFFSTLGGLALFGVMGFLIGPIVMALFLSLLSIYEKEFGRQLKEYNR